MTDSPAGDAEEAAKDLDSTSRGTPAHRRYSPKGIMLELKGVVWPTPKEALVGLLGVVLLGGALAFLLFGLDHTFSSLTLKLFGADIEVSAAWKWALGVGAAISAISAGVFALKHPSPGDTLASIFGGQLVAQGGGLSPREKRLERRMGISVAAFFIFSLAFGLIF